MAKKQLGQHWLTNNDALQAAVDACGLQPNDHVLEIGPGLGYLTDKLVKTGAAITALEFDQDLIKNLQNKYSYTDSVEIIEGDVRTYDLNQLNPDYKICANIPYYLTANLLRRLTDEPHKPSRAALLVQKEVAQKVAATESRSMLAVLVQAWYKPNLRMLVPASMFEPAPKVDSQILVLNRLEKPLVDATDWQDFVHTVKVAFASPRKKLRANIAAGLQIPKSDADGLLTSSGISVDVRAESLTATEWLALMKVVKSQ